jgi:hypothetical protein
MIGIKLSTLNLIDLSESEIIKIEKVIESKTKKSREEVCILATCKYLTSLIYYHRVSFRSRSNLIY